MKSVQALIPPLSFYRGGLLFAFLSLLATNAARAQLYNIGGLGGNSFAWGINDNDEVVGSSYTSGGNEVAVSYANGVLTNLGTLGGNFSVALAVNDSGQVAGTSTDSNGNDQAFRYANGTMTGLGSPIGTPSPSYPGILSQGTAINDEGTVAGQASNGVYLDAFTITDSGTAVDLGPQVQGSIVAGIAYSGESIATGINGSGGIIGVTDLYNPSNPNDGGYTQYGFLDQTSYNVGTSGTHETTTYLAPLGGDDNNPTAINNLGEIVGRSSTNVGSSEAWISNNGGPLQGLGTLGGSTSAATAINEGGDVVGNSMPGASRYYYDQFGDNVDAFLYTPQNGMQDLNTLYAPLLVSGTGSTPGFTRLVDATGINYQGDISGFGSYWNGTTTTLEGYLLLASTSTAVTPTSNTTTVSPGGSYSAVPSATATGGYGSTAALVGGTNNTADPEHVTIGSTNAGGKFDTGKAGSGTLASDVFTVSGNDGSVFALQLTFSLAAANLNGGAQNMVLLWEEPGTDTWENAVLGDHNPNVATQAEQDYQGSFAAFEAQYGVTDANLGDFLGAYGVDTTNDTVWAVIDHNSNFGTGNPANPPTASATPEPSTWALLLGGLALLAYLRQRVRGALV